MPTRFHIAYDRDTRRWQVRKDEQRLPLITHPSRDEAILDAERFAAGGDAVIILHPEKPALPQWSIPQEKLNRMARKLAS